MKVWSSERYSKFTLYISLVSLWHRAWCWYTKVEDTTTTTTLGCVPVLVTSWLSHLRCLWSERHWIAPTSWHDVHRTWVLVSVRQEERLHHKITPCDISWRILMLLSYLHTYNHIAESVSRHPMIPPNTKRGGRSRVGQRTTTQLLIYAPSSSFKHARIKA
jgi:hypothetical protein